MSNDRQQSIEALQRGETVSFRAHGNSMTPRIASGSLLTLEAINDYSTLEKGDAVFCKVRSSKFVHKIYGIDKRDGLYWFQIGNNHGHINGWTSEKHVYGKLIKVEK